MVRIKAVIQHYIGKPIYFTNTGECKPIISTGTLLSYGPNRVVIDFDGETIVRDYDQIAIKYERTVLQPSNRRDVEQTIPSTRYSQSMEEGV